MKAKATVVTLTITKKGEKQYFQINLPRDIERITGIQAAIMKIQTLFEVPDRYLSGIIKLQAENIADMCFTTEVSIGQCAMQKAITGFQPTESLLKLMTAPDADTELHQLDIRNSYTLYGCYEDLLMKKVNTQLIYTVKLYVWTEANEVVKNQIL